MILLKMSQKTIKLNRSSQKLVSDVNSVNLRLQTVVNTVMLNENGRISVRTSVVESNSFTVTNSRGQGSFGAALASWRSIHKFGIHGPKVINPTG